MNLTFSLRTHEMNASVVLDLCGQGTVSKNLNLHFFDSLVKFIISFFNLPGLPSQLLQMICYICNFSI